MVHPIWCYLALGICILLTWHPRALTLCKILLIIAVALAVLAGVLQAPALTAVTATLALLLVLRQGSQQQLIAKWPTSTSKTFKIVIHALILVVAYGLYDHVWPGFRNWQILSAHKFSADALPFNLYLNFDKAFFAAAYLMIFREVCVHSQGWKQIAKQIPIYLLPLIAVMLVLSFAIGYVNFDAKYPPEFWSWAANNLIFVCVAEEVLFRQHIQGRLQKWALQKGRSQLWPIAIGAVLFGIYHYKGGPSYIALSAAAGTIYGLAYQRSGRIEVSILTHFTLNTIHILFFTYPALA